MIAYTHGAEALAKYLPADAVAIPDEMSRRFLPRERLGQLTSNPLRCGMRRDVHPNEIAAGDPDDDETVRQPEADGGHNKEIDGSNVRSVVAQKGAVPTANSSADKRMGRPDRVVPITRRIGRGHAGPSWQASK